MGKKNHSKSSTINPSTVPEQQTVAFAGKQYQINDCGNLKPRRAIFRESILRMLYSNFKWYGMERYEANYIENAYIMEGKVAAVKTSFSVDAKSPDGVFFGRPGAYINNGIEYCDFYGNPIGISITGYNNKTYEAPTQEDFVIGFDTCAYVQNGGIITPIWTYIDTLSLELNDAFEAWKVAAETNKLGMVFECENERQATLLRNTLGRVSANEPWIVSSGNLTGKQSVIFRPSNSTSITDYHINFMNVWGSVMDLLGFENNSANKKERMVVTEAEMTRNLSRYLAADRLKARKEFCEECNKKFGTKYRVENYLASMVDETPNEANIYGDSEKMEEKNGQF